MSAPLAEPVTMLLFTLPTADRSLQGIAPPLQTPFIPQSFCPAWRAAHSYELQLTRELLAALATQVRSSARACHFSECPVLACMQLPACMHLPGMRGGQQTSTAAPAAILILFQHMGGSEAFLAPAKRCCLQSLRVEVWHHCPRAAAGPSREREVLLGVGAAPLVDVLRKPQVREPLLACQHPVVGADTWIGPTVR